MNEIENNDSERDETYQKLEETTYNRKPYDELHVNENNNKPGYKDDNMRENDSDSEVVLEQNGSAMTVDEFGYLKDSKKKDEDQNYFILEIAENEKSENHSQNDMNETTRYLKSVQRYNISSSETNKETQCNTSTGGKSVAQNCDLTKMNEDKRNTPNLNVERCKLGMSKSEHNDPIYVDIPQRPPSSNIHRATEWYKGNKTICLVGLIMTVTILVLLIVIGIISGNKKETDAADGGDKCSWSDWSSWTECQLLPFLGTQHRVSVYRGSSVSCKPNETVQTRKCQDLRFNFTLEFNATTINSDTFLTKDRKILSNYIIDNYFPVSGGHLQNYSGAIANRCLTANSKIYFVVAFNFTIMKHLEDGTLVFEVAVSEEDQVDSFPYVGANPNGWSLSVFHHEDFGGLHLAAFHGDEYSLRTYVVDNVKGKTAVGELAFIIDRERDELSFLDETRVIHKFNEFRSNKPLCPVFGVFARGDVKVSLEIKRAYDFTDLFHHFVT